jgi:hypothetical protein
MRYPDEAGMPEEKMVAALCRFADIEPADEHFPFADERVRLSRFAMQLAADADFPPAVIIDSGNGIQPLWVIERETLSPTVISRVDERPLPDAPRQEHWTKYTGGVGADAARQNPTWQILRGGPPVDAICPRRGARKAFMAVTSGVRDSRFERADALVPVRTMARSPMRV